MLKLDPESSSKHNTKTYTHKKEQKTDFKCGTKFKLTERDITVDHSKRKKPEIDITSVVKVQSAIRRFLAIMKRRRELFGVICIFYVKTERKVAKITVKSVQLKQTIKERHTVKDKKDNHVDKRSEEVKEINMIEGYWLICENMTNLQNKFEEILKQIPPRNYLIDYLRKAITVKWLDQQHTIIEFIYRPLTQSEIDEIASVHK